jgi:hypothetical protein
MQNEIASLKQDFREHKEQVDKTIDEFKDLSLREHETTRADIKRLLIIVGGIVAVMNIPALSALLGGG